MKKVYVFILFTIMMAIALVSFRNESNIEQYVLDYNARLSSFKTKQLSLLDYINKSNIHFEEDIEKIKEQIDMVRMSMKGMDFWFRYLEPIAYKKINGPLPVEWETEVFEKFEKPYKREGAGLTLAFLYLDEKDIEKDSLVRLIQSSIDALQTFGADSITKELKTYHHFYLCNRLFLLNLAAIYTTGFECPNTDRVIPELRLMLSDVNKIYKSFNESFPNTALTVDYIALYEKLITFVNEQPIDYTEFDNFTFIKQYINPLFTLNQKLLNQYKVSSNSFVDYSLNKTANSIFSKDIYNGQNPKGIFLRVKDEKVLAEIDKLGKLLFYDPILSGNTMRSCASCHKSTDYFTDTTSVTSFQFNHQDFLPRNTPSLINAEYNHLLLLNGKHISLQDQGKDVITNPIELGCDEKTIVQRILNCPDYKKAFEKLLAYTPQETEVTFDHIVSAITFYYSKFSKYSSSFDNAINGMANIDTSVKKGFNLFMSKAQCATCHFVPQFNGVKPPFVSSEFEVLGVPKDTTFKALSDDKGRFEVNPAVETRNAFRTGSIRNAEYTKPYMHNGVFTSLMQVIDFYDKGGGAGRGLKVDNQTLSSDSLHLTKEEKDNLLAFIKSLNEDIPFESVPERLPSSKQKELNHRKVGGVY